jgi:O-succinylbenzoic acid--CoA ligase
VIDWDGGGTETLLNPRLPSRDAERVRALIARAGALPAHVWLTTSGATGRLKPVALAKEALLTSARAVNAHLSATARDTWLNPLPSFHVGGLAIHARAHLSGARVVTLETWNPDTWLALADTERVALTSLVPTQVSDLLRTDRRAPRSLRLVVVGGGSLAPALYRRARALGWPVLPSYGATECGSQAATALPASLDGTDLPTLETLPHLTLRADADGRIAMRGASLFTGYATDDGLHDPKRGGWWHSDDLGTMTGRTVTIQGRVGDVVKILGESVALGALQETLDVLLLEGGIRADAALFATPDPRAGAALHLAWAGDDRAGADRVRDAFNARVAPYERISTVAHVARIPRTALGKVILDDLRHA